MRRVAPSETAWAGAALMLLFTTVLLLVLRFAYASSGMSTALVVVLGVPLQLAIAVAGAGLLLFVHRLMSALLPLYRWVLAGALFVLVEQVFTGSAAEKLVPTVYVVLTTSLLGGGLFGVVAHFRRVRRVTRGVCIRAVMFLAGVAAVVLAVRWLGDAGEGELPAVNAALASPSRVAPIDLPDPAEPGPHRVKRLSYGSGKDLRRHEYGAGADLITPTFDGAPFVDGWRGFDGWARTRYWGFGPGAMPLNALVWVPEGEGPFPLVLIVHGNHRMSERSEPGYAYLADNLASHGYIVASVDENFLNGAPWYNLTAFGVEPLSGDNAARGVLLLEHLKLFRGWNEAPDSPFHHKVDMDRIALMGHSRGGEAIAVAAAFNKLSFYPDNASIKFDYGFNIRSLVAISTTDRQYQPGGTGIVLKDVNYLALQGTNDGDVPYFMGMQQFERLALRPGSDQFKAAVYIYRANHGQFNRVWGSHDKSVWPKRLFFNRRPLLAAEEQERIAKVFITAFLEATLHGRRGYVPLFQDYRAGLAWLPDTIYLNRYRDPEVKMIADFSEDIDLTTTTMPGGAIAGEGLQVWREHPPTRPALWDAIGTRSVHLGWDRRRRGQDASYTITLPPGLPPLGPESRIFMALADGDDRAAHGAPRPPIDLSVEVIDAAGAAARVPLAEVLLLQPRLETRVWKGWFAQREPLRLAVFNTFVFPLAKFVARNPTFDPRGLRAVRLVFDRTPAGMVIVDNVGIRP